MKAIYNGKIGELHLSLQGHAPMRPEMAPMVRFYQRPLEEREELIDDVKSIVRRSHILQHEEKQQIRGLFDESCGATSRSLVINLHLTKNYKEVYMAALTRLDSLGAGAMHSRALPTTFEPYQLDIDKFISCWDPNRSLFAYKALDGEAVCTYLRIMDLEEYQQVLKEHTQMGKAGALKGPVITNYGCWLLRLPVWLGPW